MKRFFILIASALCCTSVAFAQFANGGGSSIGSASTDGWSGFRFSYGFDKLKVTVKEDGYSESETGSFSELTLGYAKAFSISQSTPLFLEMVPELSYILGNDEDLFGDDEPKLSVLSVGIPVNLAYRFDFGNDISLVPYAGIKAKVNIIGKVKFDDEDIDMFDDDNGGKRFQMGWQIGAGLNFNKFYVGLGYHADIMPIAKATVKEYDYSETDKTSSFRLTVGVNF